MARRRWFKVSAAVALGVLSSLLLLGLALAQDKFYIVGFLAVQLTEYNKNGSSKSYMRATVQQYVASGEWSNSENTCSTPLFYSEKLTH